MQTNERCLQIELIERQKSIEPTNWHGNCSIRISIYAIFYDFIALYDRMSIIRVLIYRRLKPRFLVVFK